MKCGYCHKNKERGEFHINHRTNFDVICKPCHEIEDAKKKDLVKAIKKYRSNDVVKAKQRRDRYLARQYN